MKQVHFVHAGDAYLPELLAYREHLQQRGHVVQVHRQAAEVPASADVVWWLCGRVEPGQARRLHASLQVHEYASASVGRWPGLKDRLKRWLHPRPDYRVFQSDWLRQRMGFADNVPYCLRDMAVPEAFVQAQVTQPPDVDLVYLGEMRRLQAFVPVLHAIAQAGLRLLLVGEMPPALRTQLQGLPGLILQGRVPQQAVPAQLLRARAGLNLMPPVLPVREQTSTKVLEYLAVGLPVISNAYPWAERCAAQHPGRILLLPQPQRPETWQALASGWPAPDPERRHWRGPTWPRLLESLPVWQALGLT